MVSANGRRLLLAAALLFRITQGQNPFKYPNGKFPLCASQDGAVDSTGAPLPPNSDFYFDEAGLQCNACGTNKEVELGGSRCKCKIGFKKEANQSPNALSVSPDNDFECNSCAATLQTSFRDGSACCGCDGSTGAVLLPGQSDCSCQSVFRSLSEFDPSVDSLFFMRLER